MRCLIQYNILLKSKYGSLRVHKSTWQVGAVYSFFCYCRKMLIHQDIYIRLSKRGPPSDSSFQQNRKNGELENEGYKIYYCPFTSTTVPYAACILDCSACLQIKFQIISAAAAPNKIKPAHFIIFNIFFLMFLSPFFFTIFFGVQSISENTIFLILSLLVVFLTSPFSSINSEALSSISLILICIASISLFNQKFFKHLSSTPQSGFYRLGIHLKLLRNLIYFFVLVVIRHKNLPV